MGMVYCDVGYSRQFGIQDPASTVAEGIISLHDDLMVVLVFVVCFVGCFLFRIVLVFQEGHQVFRYCFVHGVLIEVVWTVVPALVLMGIALPSFTLLYTMEESDLEESVFSVVKVIGHQWYWSYDTYYALFLFDGASSYDNLKDIADYHPFHGYDSYMLPTSQMELERVFDGFRLLEVDHYLNLPVRVSIRLLVTSADVLHSWTVPSFGVKVDACPSRLNEVLLFVKRPGVFYGQCSELCGVNHAFMPIAVQVFDFHSFAPFNYDIISYLYELRTGVPIRFLATVFC